MFVRRICDKYVWFIKHWGCEIVNTFVCEIYISVYIEVGRELSFVCISFRLNLHYTNLVIFQLILLTVVTIVSTRYSDHDRTIISIIAYCIAEEKIADF